MQVTTDKSKYLAFVLSEATKQKLAQAIGEHFPVRVCHHITVLFDIKEENLKSLQVMIDNGTPFFKTEGFFISEDCVVVSVELNYLTGHNPGTGLAKLNTIAYRLDGKRLHITYERKPEISNKDSSKIFDRTISYRYIPLNMALEGEFQMLDKGAGTPCVDRTVVVERHPSVIVDKAVYIPCGLFTRGNPDYFLTTDFEGGYKSITAPDPEYAKLMEIWNKNKNCTAIAIPATPKKEKYNFIRNGYQGAGWVAMGETEEGNPKTFILRGNNGGEEKVVELLRVGSNQRYWELVDAWKKHISKALSFPFLLHAVQWEVGEFTEEGYPKVFFTNYAGLYSAINFRDGRFNEALKNWCSANNKPVLTMRMVAGEMQFIPAKEETFTFAKASIIGEGWTPCGGFSSEGNPAAFVLRNKNGPSSTVDMNMHPGSTYQRILAAWKALHEPESIEEGWMPSGFTTDGYPVFFVRNNKNGPASIVQHDMTTGSEYMVLLKAWRTQQESGPTDEERWNNTSTQVAAGLIARENLIASFVPSVPDVKPVFRDENHPDGWVAYQPGGDILGFALFIDGQVTEEIGLGDTDKSKFEKLEKAYKEYQDERIEKARRETVIKLPTIMPEHISYIGENFNEEGYPTAFVEMQRDKKGRIISLDSYICRSMYPYLISEWCLRTLKTPVYPVKNEDGPGFKLVITPHAAKVQKAQCKHDNWKPSRDCQ